MGWTSYHATNYTRRGEVDRKAECDSVFTEDGEYGKWEVLKSSMCGSTYYAAVKRTMPSGKTYVFGAVCLTTVDSKDYFNFSYKDMSEDMGPGDCKCPVSILDLLSPTENEYALEWRRRCRENAKGKNSLGRLPVGSVIEFKKRDGSIVRLVKRSPAYQFKTPWWQIVGENHYFKKNHIPAEYSVISAA